MPTYKGIEDAMWNMLGYVQPDMWQEAAQRAKNGECDYTVEDLLMLAGEADRRWSSDLGFTKLVMEAEK